MILENSLEIIFCHSEEAAVRQSPKNLFSHLTERILSGA
jgi:hypothetical protein